MIHRVASLARRGFTLHPSLLEQCQLLPEEQILRCEGAPSPEADGDKSKEIEQNQCCYDEAVPESDEQTQWCEHKKLSIARSEMLSGGQSRREVLFAEHRLRREHFTLRIRC